jgi:hypothetical protein
MRRHVKYRQFHVCDAQLQSILLYPGYLWGVEGGVWRSCVEYRHPPYPGDRTPSWEFSWIPSPCSYTIHFCIHPTDPSTPPGPVHWVRKNKAACTFVMMEKEFFLTCTVSTWQLYNTGTPVYFVILVTQLYTGCRIACPPIFSAGKLPCLHISFRYSQFCVAHRRILSLPCRHCVPVWLVVLNAGVSVEVGVN